MGELILEQYYFRTDARVAYAKLLLPSNVPASLSLSLSLSESLSLSGKI